MPFKTNPGCGCCGDCENCDAAHPSVSLTLPAPSGDTCCNDVAGTWVLPYQGTFDGCQYEDEILADWDCFPRSGPLTMIVGLRDYDVSPTNRPVWLEFVEDATSADWGPSDFSPVINSQPWDCGTTRTASLTLTLGNCVWTSATITLT